eukprot:Gregarina_sp_Poly_1__4862@NODE_258_length_10499_cov_54_071223_g225_i0_p2_GENE_NODE_258_length_10499_cov_54_071223_g225_i0NODE_258_length_10499_cov_54_071223_g225_i0_p2_ORF_typecomplete_len1070_score152_18_NODE_258_length_10499_cov_54_071223_g225_i0729010472
MGKSHQEATAAINSVLDGSANKFPSRFFLDQSARLFIYDEADKMMVLRPLVIKALITGGNYVEAYHQAQNWDLDFGFFPKLNRMKEYLGELNTRAISEPIELLRAEFRKSDVKMQAFDIWTHEKGLMIDLDGTPEGAELKAVGVHPDNIVWIRTCDTLDFALKHIRLKNARAVCVTVREGTGSKSFFFLVLGVVTQETVVLYTIDIQEIEKDKEFFPLAIQLQYLLTDEVIMKIYRTEVCRKEVKDKLSDYFGRMEYPLRTGFEDCLQSQTVADFYRKYLKDHNKGSKQLVFSTEIESIEKDLLSSEPLSKLQSAKAWTPKDNAALAVVECARCVGIANKLIQRNTQLSLQERERAHFISTQPHNRLAQQEKVTSTQERWQDFAEFDLWLGERYEHHPLEFLPIPERNVQVPRLSIENIPRMLEDFVKARELAGSTKLEITDSFQIPAEAYSMSQAPQRNFIPEDELWFLALSFISRNPKQLKDDSYHGAALVNAFVGAGLLQDAINFIQVYAPFLASQYIDLQIKHFEQQIWKAYFVWGCPTHHLGQVTGASADSDDLVQKFVSDVTELSLSPLFIEKEIIGLEELKIKPHSVQHIGTQKELEALCQELSFLSCSAYLPMGLSLCVDPFTNKALYLAGAYVTKGITNTFVIHFRDLMKQVFAMDNIVDYLCALVNRIPNWIDGFPYSYWNSLREVQGLETLGRTSHCKSVYEVFRFRRSFERDTRGCQELDLGTICREVTYTTIRLNPEVTHLYHWHVLRAVLSIRLGETLIKHCSRLIHWRTLLEISNLDIASANMPLEVVDFEPIMDKGTAQSKLTRFITQVSQPTIVGVSWQSQGLSLAIPVMSVAYRRRNRLHCWTFTGKGVLGVLDSLQEIANTHLVVTGRDFRLLPFIFDSIWGLADIYRLQKSYNSIIMQDYPRLLTLLTREKIDESVRLSDWSRQFLTREQKNMATKETALVVVAAETLMEWMNFSTVQEFKTRLDLFPVRSVYDATTELPEELDQWNSYFNDDEHHIPTAVQRARETGYPSYISAQVTRAVLFEHSVSQLIKNLYVTAFQ